MLKAKFEGGSSQFSFKRLVPGSFNLGLIGSTCTTLLGGDSTSAASRAGRNLSSPLPGSRFMNAFSFFHIALV
jgi:hypothetical protein